MANLDIGNFLGVKDKRAGTGTTTVPFATPTNYDDIASLRARLTVINGTTYTSANLDKMTKNDMIYAVRLNDDVAGMI